MIVRTHGESFVLIAQPDHAHLAGAIMQRARRLAEHPRRAAILHAVAEHDNGWAEEDRQPLRAPDGGIDDFVHAPADVRQRVWPRGIGRLARDPWAAALVAEHALTIYDRYRDAPDWQEFFETVRQLRERFRRRRDLPDADLRADYTFVRLGDLISLVFCTGWTDEQRIGEWSVRLSGARVVVSPDPFAGERIPVTIAARAVPKRVYSSDDALQDAWARATPTNVSGAIGG